MSKIYTFFVFFAKKFLRTFFEFFQVQTTIIGVFLVLYIYYVFFEALVSNIYRFLADFRRFFPPVFLKNTGKYNCFMVPIL